MSTDTRTAKKKRDDDQGVSQGRLVARRFFTNPGAMISLVVLILTIGFAISAIGLGPIPGWWKWDYTSLQAQVNGGRPTLEINGTFPFIHLGDHPFGQSRIGIDYFAQTMRGILNSTVVWIVIGGVATVLGAVVGALAGYYRGWIDAVLMRITDVFIVLPAIVIGAVVGQLAGAMGVWFLSLVLGAVSWMTIARLVRAEFLTLREREFVEAARVAGASDFRIIFKHILPNAVGVLIVAATLIAAAAILLETALSYLGYGIRPPEVSLGTLISANESAFATRPWLFWWPAAFIVIPALCINFIGDGLRDSFDPRQRRFSRRRVKPLPVDEVEAAVESRKV